MLCTISSPLICYSYLGSVHRLKSFSSACKSLDLNAHAKNAAKKRFPLPFWLRLHIYFTISAHWFDVCEQFAKLCPFFSLCILRWQIERKRMHNVSFIILNFIKIYLPHKNMKPWIMSSGNHESTSNQLKITAHLNTLSLCTLHHIVSFIEYEWHGNSSSFTTIAMATNSMPAFHQTHQNEAHLRSYSRWSWILAFLRTRSHFYFPNFVSSLTCLILLWHGEFRSFCI